MMYEYQKSSYPVLDGYGCKVQVGYMSLQSTAVVYRVWSEAEILASRPSSSVKLYFFGAGGASKGAQRVDFPQDCSQASEHDSGIRISAAPRDPGN